MVGWKPVHVKVKASVFVYVLWGGAAKFTLRQTHPTLRSSYHQRTVAFQKCRDHGPSDLSQ